ncbi:MAG: hypothetical protein DB853_16625 [Candidatus Brocadia sp.]|nr:MAG: hypothetical protein DB853_16625 [Candidatus Brocadia sp.]
MLDSFSKIASDVNPAARPRARFRSVVWRQKAKKETKIWASILLSNWCHMGRMESDPFKSLNACSIRVNSRYDSQTVSGEAACIFERSR